LISTWDDIDWFREYRSKVIKAVEIFDLFLTAMRSIGEELSIEINSYCYRNLSLSGKVIAPSTSRLDSGWGTPSSESK
jgi:hypothetical protein